MNNTREYRTYGYNVHGSSNSIPVQSTGRSETTVHKSPNPSYRAHYYSYADNDEVRSSKSTWEGNSAKVSPDDSTNNANTIPNIGHKNTDEDVRGKVPTTEEVPVHSNIIPSPLSWGQGEKYSYSSKPSNTILADHSSREPNQSVDDGMTTPGVIRTSLITHPALSNNLISIDTSHSVQEEMVNFQSPMLTRHTPSEGTPGPFAPRFQVPRWEISDSEWEEEIKEGFMNSGLVPGLLPWYPPGLVNINYGVHGCVHLGTQMTAETTSNPPSRVSFPAEPHRIYSLLFLDVSRMSVVWLVTNIPGSDILGGQTIAEYQPPAPHTPTQYLVLAMLQSAVISKSALARYQARLCQYRPRNHFHLRHFLADQGIEMIVAANYFVVEHDTYVDSIDRYCHQIL